MIFYAEEECTRNEVVGVVLKLFEYYTIESIKNGYISVKFISLSSNNLITVNIKFGERYVNDLNTATIITQKPNKANGVDSKIETIKLKDLEKTLLVIYFNYI